MAKAATATAVGGNVDRAKLATVIERLENIAAEKKLLATDEKEVLAEAKVAGFIPKEIRGLVKRRQMDEAERTRQNELEEAIDRLEHILSGTAGGIERVVDKVF